MSSNHDDGECWRKVHDQIVSKGALKPRCIQTSYSILSDIRSGAIEGNLILVRKKSDKPKRKPKTDRRWKRKSTSAAESPKKKRKQ